MKPRNASAPKKLRWPDHELEVVGDQERNRDHQAAEQGAHRPGERNRGIPPPCAQSGVVDVDRGAGQADAAEKEEGDRHHDAHQDVRVSERVQRQVALRDDHPVATQVGHQGVAELVDAHAR